jgi:hypothetical protein
MAPARSVGIGRLRRAGAVSTCRSGFDVPETRRPTVAGGSARSIDSGSGNPPVLTCRTGSRVPEVAEVKLRLADPARARGIGRFRRAQAVLACRRRPVADVRLPVPARARGIGRFPRAGADSARRRWPGCKSGSRLRPGLARSHGFDVPELFSRAGGGRDGCSARDSGSGSRSLPRLAESGDSGVRGRFSRAEDGRTAQDRRFGSQSRPRLAELNGFDVPDGFLRAGGSRGESSARDSGLGSRNRTVLACRSGFRVPEVAGVAVHRPRHHPPLALSHSRTIFPIGSFVRPTPVASSAMEH